MKALVKENKALKRKLSQLEAKAKAGTIGQASKTVAAIQRKIQRALGGSSTPTRRRRRRTSS